MYPESIKNLVDSFKSFPGIGEKTAERMAFNLLDFDEERIDLIQKSIKDARLNIHKCPVCQTLTDKELCQVCSDDTRNKDVLCIVEDSKIVFLFEKMGMYKGKYHVLNGLISPLDDVNPEDIGIDKLLDHLNKNDYKEIILSFKPNVEGEITSLYIKKILENTGIKITRLASGVPIGADMEYIDSLTLSKALEDRKEIA